MLGAVFSPPLEAFFDFQETFVEALDVWSLDMVHAQVHVSSSSSHWGFLIQSCRLFRSCIVLLFFLVHERNEIFELFAEITYELNYR
jgi:hypothetical protein